MTKRVLDVGQCSPDHSAIRRLLESRFAATVVQAHSLTDTLAELRREPVDLVLINRKLDADYSDGMEILAAIKADAALARVPVMVVSNYAEAQAAAVAAGAVPGFGKAELSRPDTLEKLPACWGDCPLSRDEEMRPQISQIPQMGRMRHTLLTTAMTLARSVSEGLFIPSLTLRASN